MPSHHFEPTVLQKFLLGQLEAHETGEVVQHLLGGCDSCQKITESLWCRNGDDQESHRDEAELESLSLDGVLLAAQRREAELQTERSKAPLLHGELQRHPAARQKMMIQHHRRFQTWGLCELMLKHSWDARFDDATSTLTYAEAAVTIAENLDPEHYGAALTKDLEARAWGLLANAQRIGSDFRAAEEGFRIAEARLEEGTQDPLERADILRSKATLRYQQGRFQEAKGLYERIMAIYERSGDEEQRGAAMTQLGMIFAEMERLEEAIELTREGMELMGPEADAKSLLILRHNLIYYYRESGDAESAMALLQETRPLYHELGDRLNLLRLRRLEGQIALQLGHVALAEAAFLEARNGFVARGSGLDAAVVSLELAQVYIRQGRTAETRQIASQMVPIFQAQDLHHEAIAALIVFQQAVEAEQATAEMVQDMLTYLERVKPPALRPIAAAYDS